MTSLIIAFLFYVLLAAFSKSVKDVISFRYAVSIFANFKEKYQHWLNPVLSWRNKYTGVFLLDALTRTILVPLTDLLHASDAIKTFAIGMSFWFGNEIADAYSMTLAQKFLLLAVGYFIEGAVFELGFTRIFISKDAKKREDHAVRRLTAEVYSDYSNFLATGMTLLKSIASGVAVFLIILSQLWIMRLIAGSYESIHQVPDSLQWPEAVIVIEITGLILYAFVRWIISMRKEKKQRSES